MEYWIYIAILGAFTFMETKSDTIVYPGKSALHSYSPARGEFPVESLFGRGYFSYIDDHGVARLVNLEPNPLFGVRVGGDGKLSADRGNSVELRNDLNSQRQKDRLKPIKEFDEMPFQDNLGVQAAEGVFASRVPGGKVESPEISKQQEPNSLKSKIEPGLKPGMTYLVPRNVPLMYSKQAEIASGPSVVQSALYPGNPFLNQQVLLPMQKPSLPEQFLFVASPSGQMNLAPIAASASQASPGQYLVFPQSPIAATKASIPSSSQVPFSSSENPINPQPISSSSNESPSSGPSSLQNGQGQFPVNSTPISPPSPQTPTPPINSAAFQPILSSPQAITPNPIFSAPILPVASNPFFPPSRHPSGMLPPQQEIFMIQPGNPFFAFNNNQDKPAVWPILATSTTPSPSINADKTNPFLPNSLKADIKPSDVEGQSTSTTAKPIAQSFIPITCNFHSVGGPIPEQVKDSPEVEQAKRDHFRAHELALAQLQQARQNNDNASEEVNESSSLTPPPPLPSSSLVTSDNSSSSTETANAPLDQLAVTSGPTITFNQTSTVRAAESEASTLQPLPV